MLFTHVLALTLNASDPQGEAGRQLAEVQKFPALVSVCGTRLWDTARPAASLLQLITQMFQTSHSHVLSSGLPPRRVVAGRAKVVAK